VIQDTLFTFPIKLLTEVVISISNRMVQLIDNYVLRYLYILVTGIFIWHVTDATLWVHTRRDAFGGEYK